MANDTSHVKLPVLIKITRLAVRMMDDDNFIFASKFLRDEICGLLRPEKARGQADGDKLIKFEYLQEKSKEHNVRIEIFSQ